MEIEIHEWWLFKRNQRLIWILLRCVAKPTTLWKKLTRDYLSHSRQISRERYKSAPYLRLKNSKKTSKCQIFSFTVPKKAKSWTEFVHRRPASADPWRATRGDFFGFFTISVAKHQKIEGGPFGFFSEVSQCRKKLKGGILWDVSTSILSRNIKKLKGPL